MRFTPLGKRLISFKINTNDQHHSSNNKTAGSSNIMLTLIIITKNFTENLLKIFKTCNTNLFHLAQ